MVTGPVVSSHTFTGQVPIATSLMATVPDLVAEEALAEELGGLIWQAGIKQNNENKPHKTNNTAIFLIGSPFSYRPVKCLIEYHFILTQRLRAGAHVFLLQAPAL